MDGLSALRQAISTNRDSMIVEEGDELLIEGVRYACSAATAFRRSKTGKHYPLLCVWLQWKHRDAGVNDFIKIAKAARTDFVLVTDKTVLLQFLRGVSEATDYIDSTKLGIVPTPSDSALPVAVALETLELAILREVPYRTRGSILRAAGKVRALFLEASNDIVTACVYVCVLYITLPTPLRIAEPTRRRL